MISNNLQKSVIQQFFNNTNVFITGATGFIGNVIVEKLLRFVYAYNFYYKLNGQNLCSLR